MHFSDPARALLLYTVLLVRSLGLFYGREREQKDVILCAATPFCNLRLVDDQTIA